MSSEQSSKRRRGLNIVTPTACTECRKQRTKCDGQKPCGRCCELQKDFECIYKIPVRRSKDSLRNEIETLRQRQRSSDVVFCALVRSDLWEHVLKRLRGGQSIDRISEWLGGALPSGGGPLPALSNLGDRDLSGASPSARPSSVSLSGCPVPGPTLPPLRPGMDNMSAIGTQLPSMNEMSSNGSRWHFASHNQFGSARNVPHTDVMSWASDIRQSPQSRAGSGAESMATDYISGSMPHHRGLERVVSPGSCDKGRPIETWTSVTNDIKLVDHLLALYFCWEYPTFASLNKEHFLQDFRDVRHRYCSPILVNALLALGCRFSQPPMALAGPNDPYSAGDHFFKESQRLFYQEPDHHSLTTIQALGIMSIREASCGNDSESWYYAGQSIRLAVEMGLHHMRDEGDEDELAVRSATFWGAFALDHAWSLATGSLPQSSCSPHVPPKPQIKEDMEASLWVAYTDEGALLQQSCEQPSNVRSVYRCFCELSELVHESLYILYSPGKPLAARDLLGNYTQYLNWYGRIPDVLRLGHNFTPAVLFAHMYYHFAILVLFQPLINLRIVDSEVLPRNVCSQAADAIQSLLRSYSQLYTLQRTPSFVPYFILTSSVMRLAIAASEAQTDEGKTCRSQGDTQGDPNTETVNLDPHVSEALKQATGDLAEMAPCHRFAEQALNILRYLAKKWNVDVEINTGGASLNPEEYDRMVRPYMDRLNFLAPNVRYEDFICNRGTRVAPVAERGEGISNPRFWPSPFQGRAVLPTGTDLKESHFALL